MVGQTLISCPEEGQIKVSTKDLGARNDDGTIQVLTIQRSKVSPKKRFGLGWFIPALKEHKAVII